MNHSSVKKQNRVLLITLVITLTAAVLLIAVTGGANRKEKEESPPIDTKITEKVPAESGNTPAQAAEDALKKPDKSKVSEKNTPAETEKPKESEKTAETEKPKKNDKPAASAAVVNQGVMPTLTPPVDAPVLKGYSGETPVFSYTMNDYRTHGGIDFLCVPGTEVCAAADGVICEVVDDPMMGVCVGISHTGGAVTRYCGLSEESLELTKVGDEVKRGQSIGSSGSTSLIESAEEDHLHFELRVNGSHENPADFMKVEYLSEMVED